MGISLSDIDIAWLKVFHPQLHINGSRIEGQLVLERQYKDVKLELNFNIEINLEPRARSIIPRVKDVDNRILSIAKKNGVPPIEMHLYMDDTACLCLDEEEKRYFPNTFSMRVYFQQLLEPYFYWVTYYEKYGIPPWPGRSHGVSAYLEYYAEGGISVEELKKHIPVDSLRKFSKMKGHHSCVCGSGMKSRVCHLDIVHAYYMLRRENLS